MAHYVCPACGGVADHPKACETPNCPRHGKPLAECRCADGRHSQLTANGSEQKNV